MNNWTEIKIAVNAADIDKAGDIANVVVPYGIYIEDYRNLEQEVDEIAHIDLIDEDLLKKDRSKAFVHIYLEPGVSPAEAVQFLSERYKSEGIKHEIELLDCAEEDWRNNWKKYYKPLAVGEKLMIVPSWYENYDAGKRVALTIDPGLAFGTGGHETTRLCLEMCEKYMKPGDDVLDVGCGSGILGISALLLGANKAVGVDIDEVAVRTAAENAALNGVQNRFTAVCGSFTDKVEGKYDIVLANIVADAIMFLSKGVRDFMKDDAVYVMSGIIDTRSDEVKAEVSKYFDIVEEHLDGGWACFAARRKQK
ncbi:MAG TPA: 50S ribosomal protein L11 methyltransferase [Ruminococcaceae bacterium]|nr:50S ribosomal protein L11 methyltransferase [Oscillospiraceae bacterium]